MTSTPTTTRTRESIVRFRSLAKLSIRERTDFGLAILGWLCVIAFLTATVLPGLSSFKVFAGTNLLTDFAPWSQVIGQRETPNSGVGDTVDSVASTSIFVVDSFWNDGVFAQWDPFTSGGYEAAALPNTALLSPLSAPWWFLPHDDAQAAIKILEFAAIALGMHLLLRRNWSLPRFTVPLATLVYGASGFMIAWTNWPQTRVAAFIPLFFWAAEVLATRTRFTGVAPMAIVTACMLLGGFPAVFAYAFYPALAFFAIRVIGLHPGVRAIALRFAKAVLGVVLGIGLAAVQIVPFAWFSTHFIDFEARSEMSHAPLPSVTLVTSFAPHLLGLPMGTASTQTYAWPLHFIEGMSYVGVVPLILIAAALLAPTRRRAPKGVTLLFAALLALLVWAVYFGDPLLEIVTRLPAVGLSPIGRMRSIIGFLAAVLAAIGAGALFEPIGVYETLDRVRVSSWSDRITAFARIAIVAFGTWTLFKALLDSRAVQSDALYWQESVLVSFIIATVFGAAALLVILVPSQHTEVLAAGLSILLVVIPATELARKWWPIGDLDAYYAETPTHEYLEENLGIDRYLGVGQTLYPGTSSVYRIRAVNGHQFTSPAWHALLTAVDPEFFLTPTYSSLSPSGFPDALNNSILDRLGVKYFVQSPAEGVPGTRGEDWDETGSRVLSESNPVRSASSTGAINGVVLRIVEQAGLPSDEATIQTRIIADSSGDVLASTTQKYRGIKADETVALLGGAIQDDVSWHLEISLQDSTASVTFATEDESGTLIGFTPIRPSNGDLVVHTGDSTIIENSSVLDRVRWASSEVVEPDETRRIALMADSTTSDSIVILQHAEEAHGVSGGSSADIDVEAEDANSQTFAVESTGAGWVVIMDPMQDGGWTATVDGEPVEIADAEQIGGAVFIPDAGEHSVIISYSAPGFKAGIVVSCIVGLIVAAIGIVGSRSFRARTHGMPSDETVFSNYDDRG